MASSNKVPSLVALEADRSAVAAASSIAQLRRLSVSETSVVAPDALLNGFSPYKSNAHLSSASLPNFSIGLCGEKSSALPILPELFDGSHSIACSQTCGAEVLCKQPSSTVERKSAKKEFVSFLELGPDNIDLVTHALTGLGCDNILWLPPLEDELPVYESAHEASKNSTNENKVANEAAPGAVFGNDIKLSSSAEKNSASFSSPSPSPSPSPTAPQITNNVRKQKSKTNKFFSFFKFSKRNSSSSGSDADHKRSDQVASEASDAGFFSEEDYYSKKSYSGRKRLFHFGYLDSLHQHSLPAACTACNPDANCSLENEPEHHHKGILSPPGVLNSRCPDLSEEEHSSIPPNIKLAPLLGLSPTFKFNHGKVLGKGASGTVRMTKSPCCSSIYAIKEFRKRKRSESPKDYIKKVTSEFSIGSRLRHQNIVEMIDIIKEGNHWYEVMEYCSGGDVYSIIKSDHMSVDDIDCIFKQLIYGVHYMHCNGIAHRDLKPENLLIDPSGLVKICDFGISMRFFPDVAIPEITNPPVCSSFSALVAYASDSENPSNAISKCRGLCGSSPYIAPEEFSGCEYDPRAVDVWSCAIVYYAMTFHGVPWESATAADPNYSFFLNNRRLTAEPLVRLPSGPQHLLSKMLEPDPAKRITIDEIMQDEWFRQIKVCVSYGHVSENSIDEFDSDAVHNHFVDLSVRKKFICVPDHIP